MDSLRELVVSLYEAPLVVKAFNNVPRFGHSSDISLVISGDNGIDFAALTDYARGTIFIAGLCLVAFVLWILALLVLKCLGRRVGIAAGHPFVENSYIGGTPKKHNVFRILMLVSTMSIAVSGIVFLIKGAQSVGNVFDDVFDGATGLSDIAEQIVNATDDVIAFGASTEPLRADLVQELQNDICTGDSTAAQEFDSAAQSIVDVLGALQDFSSTELTEIRDTFSTSFTEISTGFNDGFQSGEKYAQPMYIALPVMGIGLVLFIGAFLAWKGPYIKPYFCVQTWFIMPLFFIIVVVMAFVLSITGTLLVANSDVCLGGESKSPEGFVEVIMQKVGLLDDANVAAAANYYILDSCTGEYPRKEDVDNLLLNLSEGAESIDALKQMIENDPDTIRAACGITQQRLDEISDLIQQSFDAFENFVSVTTDATAILECEPINDVFVDFYHGALCTSGPTSLMWIFATMMAVYGLGMFIFLSRGALLPSEKVYDGTNKGMEGQEQYYHESNYQTDDVQSNTYENESRHNVEEDPGCVIYDEDNLKSTSYVCGYDFTGDGNNNDGVSYAENTKTSEQMDDLSYDDNVKANAKFT